MMMLSFFLGVCVGIGSTLIIIAILALFWSNSTITETLKEIESTKQEPIKRGL